MYGRTACAHADEVSTHGSLHVDGGVLRVFRAVFRQPSFAAQRADHTVAAQTGATRSLLPLLMRRTTATVRHRCWAPRAAGRRAWHRALFLEVPVSTSYPGLTQCPMLCTVISSVRIPRMMCRQQRLHGAAVGRRGRLATAPGAAGAVPGGPCARVLPRAGPRWRPHQQFQRASGGNTLHVADHP